MKKRFFLIGSVAALLLGFSIPFHFAEAVSSTVIDATVNTNKPSANGTTFTNVFINSSTGYAFYRETSGTCAYAKTSDGGSTWSGSKDVNPSTTCIRSAVWYDRWTPGNSTGTLIHIATIETTQDDLWYSRLDTSNDSLTKVLDISTSSQAGTYTAGATLDSITETTDGKIYAGVINTSDAYLLKCTSGCTTTSPFNWTEAGTSTSWDALANDWMILNPLPSANLLAIRFVIADSTIESKVWHSSSSTWDTSWIPIDKNCPPNTTYDGHFGTAVNGNTNAIYMASGCNIANFTTATSSIRTWTYTPASSTWVRDTDVETSSSLGITGAKIGLDINTGNIYVVYSGRTTRNTASTANVYYKISTSTTMSSWGSRQGPINQTTTDIYGARIDGMSPTRLYATWTDANALTLNGTTVALFSATTFDQAGFEVYQNQNSAQVGFPYDIENATSEIPVAGNPFRIRMLIGVTGTGIDVSAQSFKLQYATSTPGSCNPAISDATYFDVGTATSSDISFYNNSSPANGAALTANGQDPTDGTNVIVNETYVEQNNFSDDITKILTGQDGKWDFSLINNSGTVGTTYCFRIVKSDGTFLESYSNYAETQVDSPPTLATPSLNGNQSITLIEGTTTVIQVTSTVTDANGTADIFSITGMLYRTGVGASCTPDNNNCYQGTGVNCSVTGCAGNSCTAYCNYNVWYYAQPTDSGTPWAGDSWTGLIQASDTVLSGVTATSTAQQLLSLLAFETTSTVNYGSFTQGQSMASTSVTSTIISTGNTAMNVNVYGTNMTNGASSIAVGQQHFATSVISYASGTTLLANPGSTIVIDLPKTSSTNNIPAQKFYWGIAIPSGAGATSYTGHNSFVGVLHSLPWP